MSNPKLSRAGLLTSVAALIASPALAQGAASTSQPAQAPVATTGAIGGGGPTSVDQVVVTGIRASSQRAIQIKEHADQVIDTVSATEIGELPDFNAGDALKRVTGVNALLYQGEPRFIIVRGFNENYDDLLIDGFSFAATDINMGETNTGGRQVDMELLPSNLASHIDVIKTATPSIDGNWIGGLTNFVTPSAYDFKDDTFSASALGGASLQAAKDGGDKPDAQVALAGAKRFGDHDQFGLYASATYWLRDINVPQLEAGGTRNWYTSAGAPTTPYGGTGFAVPSQRLFYNYQNDRDRYGLQGRLDWRPTSNVSGYVAAYWFHQDEDSHRNDLNAAVQSSSDDLNQTPTTGTLTNVTQDMQLGRYIWHRNMYGLYGRLDADLADGWKADLGSSWSLGRVNNPQTTDEFAQSNMAFTYNTAGFAPTFTPVNPAAADNLSLYPLVHHELQVYHLNENRYDEQLNIGHNTDPSDRGLGLKFGARGTGIFQQVSLDDTVWAGAPYTLANVASGQTLCGFGCNTPIPTISPQLADQEFAKYLPTMKATPQTANEAGGTYRTHEVVLAGYGQVQYQADHWKVIAGLRVEGTFAGSSSTEAVNGVYEPVSASHDYYNLLPSALAVIDTSDISKLRLGVSETVSRPTFGESSLHGGVLNSSATTPTLTTGNPDLKPRHAENFDASHDWEFDHGHGLISAGAFYKLIHDDIFNFGVTENMPRIDVPVLVTEAQNSSHLVHDEGLEFGLSKDLEFLPAPLDGLGVSGNATLSHASFPVTLSDGTTRTFDGLPDQPSQIYNVSIYYDKGRVHGRLAWNHLGQLWDDRFPNFTPSGFYANRFQQPTNNIDVQASYDVTPHISVSVDALNVTAQGMSYRYGYNQELYQSAWSLPTELMFGIKFRN
ncbi:MAG: TonB-dependent receptor [Caulobacteraceae bacterium]